MELLRGRWAVLLSIDTTIEETFGGHTNEEGKKPKLCCCSLLHSLSLLALLSPFILFHKKMKKKKPRQNQEL